MNSSILPFSKLTTSHSHSHHIFTTHKPLPPSPSLLLTRICSSTNEEENTTSAATSENTNNKDNTPQAAVQLKFKRGARRKTRRKQENAFDDNTMMMEKQVVKKSWEEMTLNEKALELYVGEKGLLFWINKFAYASIYIIIGLWILFRFVGPALNLYQLDAPPLSPTDVLKGSPK